VETSYADEDLRPHDEPCLDTEACYDRGLWSRVGIYVLHPSVLAQASYRSVAHQQHTDATIMRPIFRVNGNFQAHAGKTYSHPTSPT
jgi:hypothetical protein